MDGDLHVTRTTSVRPLGMEIELHEIRDFLARHPPFDHLSEGELDRLPKALSVRYFRRGSDFPPADTDGDYVYLLRSGAVELRDDAGELVNKLGEGEVCVIPCQSHISLTGKTVEDTLAYLLPCLELERIKAAHPEFNDYFEHSVSQRLRKALDRLKESPPGADSLMTLSVGDLVSGRVVRVGPAVSIQEAARVMSEERVSSVLVMDGESLLGMVTLRDLRSRCLAVGLPFDRPVAQIMTRDLNWIQRTTPAFQALIEMTRLNVHHLPVCDGVCPIGVLTTTDLVRHQSANAVYMVGDIYKSADVAALAQISARVPELQVHLVATGATAEHVGQAVTSVTDALTKRLLALAEAQLGPPPVPYAWIACGSQARREQTSYGDQDNALVIDDAMKPEDDAYFAALAKIVCDGLDACGYYYCPGDVMATNPQWRQTQSAWQGYFRSWIETPEPKAVMLSSVFFDMRSVAGEHQLLVDLQAYYLALSASNQIFLAYMAANALKHRPPLGFFRNFVLIHGGDHAKTFDLKHRGVVPVVDIARVLVLSQGLDEISTRSRIEQAAHTHAVSRDMAANLIDAYEFIATLRVRHQVGRIRNGEEADNYIHPEEMSALERRHLKDAFGLIGDMQETLANRYQTGRFG